jgi:hypothetical protein
LLGAILELEGDNIDMDEDHINVVEAGGLL